MCLSSKLLMSDMSFLPSDWKCWVSVFTHGLGLISLWDCPFVWEEMGSVTACIWTWRSMWAAACSAKGSLTLMRVRLMLRVLHRARRPQPALLMGGLLCNLNKALFFCKDYGGGYCCFIKAFPSCHSVLVLYSGQTWLLSLWTFTLL